MVEERVGDTFIKLVLKKAGQLGIVWPFVMYYTRIIEVVRPLNGEVQSDMPTILAINPDRFIGDLTVLKEIVK